MIRCFSRMQLIRSDGPCIVDDLYGCVERPFMAGSRQELSEG